MLADSVNALDTTEHTSDKTQIDKLSGCPAASSSQQDFASSRRPFFAIFNVPGFPCMKQSWTLVQSNQHCRWLMNCPSHHNLSRRRFLAAREQTFHASSSVGVCGAVQASLYTSRTSLGGGRGMIYVSRHHPRSAPRVADETNSELVITRAATDLPKQEWNKGRKDRRNTKTLPTVCHLSGWIFTEHCIDEGFIWVL